MRYTEFTKQLKRSGVIESIRSFGHLIEKMEDGSIIVNGDSTEFNSLEEARNQIKQQHATLKLEEQASKQPYEELSENTIANIIKEFHDVKVTETLIESYVQFASSNIFTVDPVVQKMRSINKLDRLIEGRIQYVLNDDSIVTISENTQEILNKLLQNQTEIIEYMRESKDNFMHVLTKIEEQ